MHKLVWTAVVALVVVAVVFRVPQLRSTVVGS